jgi:hypothetical protein
MKSRVRFELVSSVAVDLGFDYPDSAITTEVANGALTALSVEVEHDDDWARDDIVQAARAALHPLRTLIGVGRTVEPSLGNALVSPITTEGPSIGLGFVDVEARVAIMRRLKTKSFHRRLVHSGGGHGVFLGSDVLHRCGDRRLTVEV